MNSANENQLEVQQSNRNCSHRSIDLSEFEPKPIHQSTTTNTADDRPIASANATQPQLIIHSSPRTPFTPIKKHSYHSFTPNNTPIKSNNTPIKSYTPVKANNTPIKAYNTPVKSYTPIRQSINPNTPIRQSINPSTPIKSTHTPIRQSINPQLILLQSDSIKPKARLTPEAIPRKKPILPGAPNPIHVNSSHSQPIFSPSYQPSSSSNTRPSLIHYDDEGETDEDDLNPSSGHQNVLVAIRLRYIDQPSRSVWSFSEADAQIWETNSSGPNHDSTFDAVFGPDCSNEEVYRSSGTKELIHSSMMGYDATVFAYGQTASGKTFTLSGSTSQPGLIPLAVSDIFEFIRSHPHRDFLLRASYLEIYNEQIIDLLIPIKDPKPMIKIRQDPSTKHFFPNPIREEVVSTIEQVEDVLKRGNLARHVSGTDFNQRSSRSHTIFSVVVESRKTQRFLAGAGSDGSVRRSKVSLIDLAGSERATSDGSRRTEGGFINKSLLTLEKVIGALSPDTPNLSSTPSKPIPQHVPFRDSKLTQILQPALKGDSKVCVICTINPTLNYGNGVGNGVGVGNGLEESKSTLRFARRVKKVTVQAKVHEILSERALITRYRQQIVDLQTQLNQAMQASSLVLPNPTTTTTEPEPTQEVMEERKEMLERLEKLQSIVLNAGNLDESNLKRRRESCWARPVSPVKGGNRDEDAEEEDEEEDGEDQLEEDKNHNHSQNVWKTDRMESRHGSLRTSTKKLKEIDLMELNELRLIISNSLNGFEEIQTDMGNGNGMDQDYEVRIRKRYEDRLRELCVENLERKRFGEEMVKLLEASQLKAKKLELFIINELQNSLKKSSKKKVRRSSIGTYFTQSNSKARQDHQEEGRERDGGRGEGDREWEREGDHDGLLDLKNEGPEIRSLRASFGLIEIGNLE